MIFTRTRRVIIGAGLAVGISLSAGMAGNAPASAEASVDYQLLWSQNFDTKKIMLPNKKLWNLERGTGANGELQYSVPSIGNISTDGKGHLLIKAQRISDMSMNETTNNPADWKILDACGTCQFKSGRMNSAGKVGFKYGRIEGRIRVAEGVGTWPAFWMLGYDGQQWPDCGEIDIVETRGYMDNVAFGTIHGPGYSGGNGRGSVFDNVKPLSKWYHTYAIDWTPDKIVFSVDYQPYFTVEPMDVTPNEWAYNNREFYLIANLAMGGEFTGEIDPKVNKAQMSIDYIKYYSINGVGKVLKHYK